MHPTETKNSCLTPNLVVGPPASGADLPPALAEMLQELAELARGPERDEHGLQRPTHHAQHAAELLLHQASQQLSQRKQPLPRGCVSSDSAGGVRIEWVRDAASVFLVVPSSDRERAFIYHEVGDDYGTEDATADRLAHWLRKVV